MEKEVREREEYNRKIEEGNKAEKLKDLSYKNVTVSLGSTTTCSWKIRAKWSITTGCSTQREIVSSSSTSGGVWRRKKPGLNSGGRQRTSAKSR